MPLNVVQEGVSSAAGLLLGLLHLRKATANAPSCTKNLV
jgi:hypothetical protein